MIHHQPSFSLIIPTFRPGGIDIIADSIHNQVMKDIELILVDDYINNRHEEVLEYLASKNITTQYLGPSKKKGFPETIHNVANAINTGFMASTKEFVMLLGDYQWLAPDFFEKMLLRCDMMKSNTCVVTPARVFSAPQPEVYSNIQLWSKEWKGHPEENNCSYSSSWIPDGWEFAGICFHWDTLAKINGYPEYIDCTTEHPISLLISWMERFGAKPYVDKNNFMHALDHRNWVPEELWHYAKRLKYGSTPFEYRENLFDLTKIERGRIV